MYIRTHLHSTYYIYIIVIFKNNLIYYYYYYSDVYGELFALTSKHFPYNEVSNIRNPPHLNLIYKKEYDDEEYDYKDTGDSYNTTFYDDYYN